jgi:uncharacterized RmlC-like cupin family protein
MSDTVERSSSGICRVRPTQETRVTPRVGYFVGISRQAVGARQLAMSLVIVPPKGTVPPHCHRGYETIIHPLSGRVETHYDQKLDNSIVNGPGDFIYIGPNIPHQPVNLSETERAVAINARNDPDQEEHVTAIDPAQEVTVTWHPRSVVSLQAPSEGPSPGKGQIFSFGADAQTAGASRLAMHRITFGPRSDHAVSLPAGTEAGLYVVRGRAVLRAGDRPEQICGIAAEEFAFVPAGMSFRVENPDSGAAVVILARAGAIP